MVLGKDICKYVINKDLLQRTQEKNNHKGKNIDKIKPNFCSSKDIFKKINRKFMQPLRKYRQTIYLTKDIYKYKI